ncbi:MAG TPA: hypothetical protein PL096_02015 [Micropepsaceae bacterium]|nr:hypothetical protein [Micropepsaceae bacterium]
MRRILASACVAVSLIAAPSAPQVFADALPMPVELNDLQKLLVGFWREDGSASPMGMGHGSVTRVLVFGNDTLAIAQLYGISYVNDFGSNAMSGSWTATRTSETTVDVNFTQGPENGTTFRLVFEGNDAFVLTDLENEWLSPSRFSRQGASPVREME